MNNNLECFYPLRDALAREGIEVTLLTLPNHGEKRSEIDNFEEGLKIFHERLIPLTQSPYSVVAFSLGALYFENWLAENTERAPDSYVLLAPAIAVNFEFIIRPFFHRLPKTFFILSQMPKMFRRYDKLYFWEYVVLLEGIEQFRSLPKAGKPELVLIDFKDELVDAKKVQAHYGKNDVPVEKIQRKNLKRSLGRHHIIFHPDYFQSNEWDKFINSILGAL
jgi:hypothetical protein